jgi:diguanylate cyclase (GGDEF)-like protein
MPMANQIIRRVLAPIPVLILVVIAVIGGSFYFAYQQVDRLTEERQAQTIRNAFTQAGHGLERELRGETIWGDAFANASVAPDSKWLETYLGSYLTTLLGYSEVYVLDSGDRPIYGYEDGQTRDGRGFEADRAGVADLIQALRDPASGPASHAALTTVDLGGGRKVVHRAISDVRLLGGEPSTVVIETILPDADPGAGTVIPERPALLVAVFHLDNAYLSTFGDSFQFSGLRWIGAGSTSAGALSPVGSDEVSTRITARDGSVVGDVAWKRELPGQELLRRMTWGFGLAAALLLSIALFGVRYFRAQSQRIIDNERREARLARTDFLTGLPNRLALSEVLTSQLASIALSDRCVGVLNIDLDRFKQINDSHGHQAGDKALVAVGARLMAEFPECFVARTGGDEFAMLVPAATADRVGIVADRVAFLLNAPLQINESLNASLGCSTGYAIAPLHGDSEAELMRRADLALYRAKKEARGRAHRFDSDLEAAALRRRAVEVALRRAVSANAIAVAYQPLMASDGEPWWASKRSPAGTTPSWATSRPANSSPSPRKPVSSSNSANRCYANP